MFAAKVLFTSLLYLPLSVRCETNIIVSNYVLCSKIGENIITKYKGNGFDAAIGIMLCEGIGKPQDSGLGGGFLGIVKTVNETFVINSRERGTVRIENSFAHSDSSKIFGKTVGIPSSMAGYKFLHQKYGKTKWYNIVRGVLAMVNKGFPVVIGDVLDKKQYQYIEESHRDIFINPDTQLPYANGETWKRPDLAKTLKRLMTIGPEYFETKLYKRTVMREINSFGGNITSKDFSLVKPLILKPYVNKFVFGKEKYKVETTPLPGGGPTLTFILRMMELYYKERPNHTMGERYYVLLESIKFAFSYRTDFGDPEFVPMDYILRVMNKPSVHKEILRKILLTDKTQTDPEYYIQKNQFHPDHGTANIVVKTSDELIVLTSTINLRFGSWIVSKYGFIYNNQMSDFSIPNRSDAGHLPPSPNNFPATGKFPISSISASIISKYDSKKNSYIPFVALGAAGGPKIITSISQVLINIFFDGMNIVEAINKPRMHHQLSPTNLETEREFFLENRRFIEKYNYTIALPFMRGDYSAVTGIQMEHSSISGTFDPRRPGSLSKF